MTKLISLFTQGIRSTIIAVASVATLGGLVAVADYAVTLGAGTNFGSKVISTVHYAEQLLCDATLGSTCAKVVAGSSAGTTDVAVVVADPNVLAAVQGPIAAGTNIIGKFGVDQTTPGTTNGVALVGVNAATALAGNGVTGTGSARVTVASDNTPFQVNPTPQTSGGLTAYFVQPTASDNHANIKNGAGQVYSVQATNNSATVNYLRLYNAATGFNGCNSATNLVGQWIIPASTSGAGIVFSFPTGMAFATGISICVTSGYATTDTTNATASAMSVNVGYK